MNMKDKIERKYSELLSDLIIDLEKERKRRIVICLI
jgi:hypothetical protein